MICSLVCNVSRGARLAMAGAVGAAGGTDQMIDLYNKYTGVTGAKKKIQDWLDEYKTLTPNKYGGQVGWLDKYK